MVTAPTNSLHQRCCTSISTDMGWVLGAVYWGGTCPPLSSVQKTIQTLETRSQSHVLRRDRGTRGVYCWWLQQIRKVETWLDQALDWKKTSTMSSVTCILFELWFPECPEKKSGYFFVSRVFLENSQIHHLSKVSVSLLLDHTSFDVFWYRRVYSRFLLFLNGIYYHFHHLLPLANYRKGGVYRQTTHQEVICVMVF